MTYTDRSFHKPRNKRVCALLTTIVFSLLCVSAVSGSVTRIGDLAYTLDETTMTASAGAWSPKSEICEIPSHIEYEGQTYTVTAISDNACKNAANLTTVILPETITSIGDYAFYYCKKLASINIPEGVTHIGTYTLSGCDNLAYIVFPGTLATVGSSCFYSASFELHINAAVPPTVIKQYANDSGNALNINATYFASNGLGKIYIPKGTYQVYATAPGWSIYRALYIEEDVTQGDVIDPLKLVNLHIQASRSESAFDISVPKGSSATVSLNPIDGFTHSVVFNNTDMTALVSNGNFSTPELTENSTLIIGHSFSGTIEPPQIVSSNGGTPLLSTPIFLTHESDPTGEIAIYYTKDGSVPDPDNATTDPDIVMGCNDDSRASQQENPAYSPGTFRYTGPFYFTLGGWHNGLTLPMGIIRAIAIRHKGTDRQVVSAESQVVYSQLTGIPHTSNTVSTHILPVTGGVEIEDYAGTVTIFDISGHIISEFDVSAKSYIPLPSGIFIIKTDESTIPVSIN